MKSNLLKILKFLIFSIVFSFLIANLYFVNTLIEYQEDDKNEILKAIEDNIENEEILLNYEKKNHNLLSNYLKNNTQAESYIPYELIVSWKKTSDNFKLSIKTKPYNEEYEYTINQILYYAFVSYLSWSDDYLFEGICYHKCDNQYLSIDLCYNYNSIGENIYNTIDMKNKKLVYLNDLVEVDSEFVDIITSTGVLKQNTEYSNHEPKYCYDYNIFTKNNDYEKQYYSGKVYNKTKILKNLKECSIPYNDINRSKKPSFYLANGRLYFYNVIFIPDDSNPVRFDQAYNTYVELEDIESKLKVEKW